MPATLSPAAPGPATPESPPKLNAALLPPLQALLDDLGLPHTLSYGALQAASPDPHGLAEPAYVVLHAQRGWVNAMGTRWLTPRNPHHAAEAAANHFICPLTPAAVAPVQAWLHAKLGPPKQHDAHTQRWQQGRASLCLEALAPHVRRPWLQRLLGALGVLGGRQTPWVRRWQIAVYTDVRLPLSEAEQAWLASAVHLAAAPEDFGPHDALALNQRHPSTAELPFVRWPEPRHAAPAPVSLPARVRAPHPPTPSHRATSMPIGGAIHRPAQQAQGGPLPNRPWLGQVAVSADGQCLMFTQAHFFMVPASAIQHVLLYHAASSWPEAAAPTMAQRPAALFVRCQTSQAQALTLRVCECRHASDAHQLATTLASRLRVPLLRQTQTA